MKEDKKDLDFLDENYLKISNALNDEERTRKSLFYIFIIALCIIGSIFLIELILVVCFYDIDKLGAFGDFFGGMINPLLTFCTFMALLMTIILQQKELSLARKELHETTEATKNSANALKEQSNSIKIQNFETTFFNMISLHNEIINNLKIKNHYLEYEYLKLNDQKELKTSSINIKKTVIQSTFDKVKIMPIDGTISEKRESIKDICTNIDNFIKDRNSSKQYVSDIYKVNDLNTNRKPTLLYDLCHQTYSDLIGHYFGNIYQILKHISTSKDIEDKRKYSDLFRAQFSSQELKLLFYHCSGSIGSTKFKPLIEEFEFLEHLSIEENNTFFEYILYKSMYKNRAFGIKNIKKIEHAKSRIIDEINTKIEKIKEEDRYKYLYLYKYFSEEDIKSCLLKAQENPKSFTDSVSINLLLIDYSENDKPKRYIFREE